MFIDVWILLFYDDFQ